MEYHVYKLLEIIAESRIYNSRIRLNDIFPEYKSNEFTQEQFSDAIKKLSTNLYIRGDIVIGILITELGRRAYKDEKQTRLKADEKLDKIKEIENKERENKSKELTIEKLQQDISLGRKTKRIWWVPYAISIISILIAAGSLWIASNSYKLSEQQQQKSMTKEELQMKIELSKREVLNFVDSHYKKVQDKDTSRTK